GGTIEPRQGIDTPSFWEVWAPSKGTEITVSDRGATQGQDLPLGVSVWRTPEKRAFRAICSDLFELTWHGETSNWSQIRYRIIDRGRTLVSVLRRFLQWQSQ